jgi:hypothetical protein
MRDEGETLQVEPGSQYHPSGSAAGQRSLGLTVNLRW